MCSRAARSKAFLRKLIDMGVPVGAGDSEVHRIRFTNIIAFVGILLNLVYTAVYYLLGLRYAPLENLAFGIAYLLPLGLNSAGRSRLARLALILIASTSLVFLAVVLGLVVAVQPLFLAMYVGTLFLFELRDRRWILTALLLVTVSLLLTQTRGGLTAPAIRVDPLAKHGIGISFLILTGLVLVAESWYFRWSWDRDRAELQILLSRYMEARNRLADRESQLVMALEIAEMATWELDLSSGCLLLSAAMKSMLGLSGDGNPSLEAALERVVPDDRPKIRSAVQGWGESRRDVTDDVVFRVTRKERGERWIRARGRIFHDAQGKPARVMGIALDFTREKTAEQLIGAQTAKMVASSKLSALGEMAGGIAHEINNPLAIIHARASRLAELASSGQPDQELVASFAGQIEATALRISRIIKALRSFARDGEQDPLQEARVRQLVEETAEMCRERLKSHGIELRIDPIPDSVTLRCRPVQISQVLLNLLNNAHDAVEGLPERWIRVEVSEASDEIFIRILDSGKGLPPEIANRVFEPFFTTKEFGRGTGLGLSISRGIIESHGGLLEVEERSDRTCFVIQLPRCP